MIDKSITFYVDKPPIDTGSDFANYYYAHTSTRRAIDDNIWEIHTSSLVDLSFELLDRGYRIFVVKNNMKKEFYPGMPVASGRAIRKEHNVMKLLIGGAFDADFICGDA